MVGEIIRLIRVRQWTKNVFCYAPLFFGAHLFDGEMLLQTTWVFMSFCCLSSAVYIFNDYCDREEDRRHPRKRERPLAKGSLPVSVALQVAILLLVLGFGVLMFVGDRRMAVATVGALFVGLNAVYSLKLKSIPLLDVSCIALGFVLRVIAGAVAIGIVPTVWILVCTYFVTLLVAIGKRRAELAAMVDGEGGGDGALQSRGVLREYTVTVLDACAVFCAALVIAFYVVYCVVSSGQLLVILTIVPAAIGVIRYVSMIRGGRGKNMEIPEEVVFKDRWLMFIGLIWGLMFGLALYTEGG